MTTFELEPWVPIREGVFRARCDPYGVTLGLVVGKDSALLVDTGSSPEQGVAIRESIAQLTSVPLTTVVVTHAHVDHAFGLGAFDDLATIGHETVADALRSPEAAAAASDVGVDPARLVAPNAPMSIIAARDLGDRYVEIGHFGAAHTAGDITVLVPDQRILFAGDLVEEGDPPGIDETTSLEGWHQVLESLQTLCRDDTIVVPGHGRSVDRHYIAWQRAGLAAVWSQCQWLVQNGIKEDDAYEHPELQWPWGEEWARAAISRGYAELAAKGHKPKTQLPLQSI